MRCTLSQDLELIIHKIMEEENNINQEQEEKAGFFGIASSFLFPLLGVIIYFVQKKSVSNPSAYLYAALSGFAIGFMIRMAAM